MDTVARRSRKPTWRGVAGSRRCLVAVAALLPALALAQSGGGFEVRRSVVAAGSGNSAGSGFTANGVVGQNVAGTVAGGGGFEVRGGFWSAPTAPVADAMFANGFE